MHVCMYICMCIYIYYISIHIYYIHNICIDIVPDYEITQAMQFTETSFKHSCINRY